MAAEILRNPYNTLALVVTQVIGAIYEVRSGSDLVTQMADMSYKKTVSSKPVPL
jgi:hypothetical protein